MATAINLLPDVRQEKVKAKRRRQTAAALATVVTAVAVGITVVMFLITQGQKLRISQLQRDINNRQNEISSDKELPKIVTTQRNLAALPEVYRQRIFISNFFKALATVSPRDYSLDTLSIDASNTIKFSGKARNYATITKFAKALEASNQMLGSGANPDKQPYFTNIQLDAATADSSGTRIGFSLTTSMSKEVTGGK